MTKHEAQTQVGRLVTWPNMDARIDQPILERLGKNGVATVSYQVQARSERFVTYKHISELEVSR